MWKTRAQAFEDANGWLVLLKTGTGEFGSILNNLRDDIRGGEFTLAEIGTSEEELCILQVKNCKKNAQKWLNRLRGEDGKKNDYPWRIADYLRHWIRKGGLSLADIGTSEEELNKLSRKTFSLRTQKAHSAS